MSAIEDKEPMTEDEALARYAELVARCGYDAEVFHASEDDLLVEALRAAGWTRLADARQNAAVERWYA